MLERYFRALQRTTNKFADITKKLTLFREKPQILTKKRKKLTQKRIFHV